MNTLNNTDGETSFLCRKRVIIYFWLLIYASPFGVFFYYLFFRGIDMAYVINFTIVLFNLFVPSLASRYFSNKNFDNIFRRNHDVVYRKNLKANDLIIIHIFVGFYGAILGIAWCVPVFILLANSMFLRIFVIVYLSVCFVFLIACNNVKGFVKPDKYNLFVKQNNQSVHIRFFWPPVVNVPLSYYRLALFICSSFAMILIAPGYKDQLVSIF